MHLCMHPVRTKTYFFIKHTMIFANCFVCFVNVLCVGRGFANLICFCAHAVHPKDVAIVDESLETHCAYTLPETT